MIKLNEALMRAWRGENPLVNFTYEPCAIETGGRTCIQPIGHMPSRSCAGRPDAE